MASVADSATSRAADNGSARRRAQVGLLFAAIVLMAVATMLVSILFPAVGDTGWFSYSSVRSTGPFFWIFLTLAAAHIVVAAVAGALAALLLVPGRGWRWATAGAALGITGAGFYALGVGGWAMVYYFAAHSPALEAPTATAFIESVNADAFRVFAAPVTGALAIALGTFLMAVGLWRAGTVPKWLPALGVFGSVITFVLPTDGLLGAAVEAPQAIAGIMVGWYAWRRYARPDAPAVAPALVTR